MSLAPHELEELQEIAESLGADEKALESFNKSLYALISGDYSELQAQSYHGYYDCTCQACEDFPALVNGVTVVYSDTTSADTTYTTSSAAREVGLLCCDGGSIDNPGGSGCSINLWEWKDVCQFSGSINIPPKCIIDYAYLRILSFNEQPEEGNFNSDSTCYIAATINDPNRSQQAIQYEHLEHRCEWRNVPAFNTSEYYNTDDISPAMQDIVNQEGWNPADWLGNRFGDSWQLILFPHFSWAGQQRNIQGGELHVYYHVEIDEIADGGVVAGGSSTISTILHETPTGGIVLGGSAEVSTTHNETASGGIVIGGTSELDDSSDITIEPIGGIIFEGSASVEQTISYTYDPIGGITYSGSIQTYPNGYLYRRLVTVPQGEVNSKLNRFSVVVRLPESDSYQAESLTGDKLPSVKITTGLVAVDKDLLPSEDNEFYVYYNGGD